MVIYEQAYAKINIVLDVVGKRPDGYHEINTVFQSLMLHDNLSFSKNGGSGVALSCSDATLPAGPENLVWRAAVLLKEHYRVSAGVKITLEKKVPAAAGLGGGSSDAAAALRGLLRFWQLPVERDVLYRLAAGLGSDVPFCLEGGTSYGTGRGEIIERLQPLPQFSVVLANPGFALSTALVYSHYRGSDVALRPDLAAVRDAIARGDSNKIIANLGNSLECAAFKLYPQIAQLKQRMSRAGASLMCGSGPTVFSLFDDWEKAYELTCNLKNEGISAWLTETSTRRELGCQYV
ncbi:MAG: 4-(cytidine 5'-diphospho)-2-C-methyl-D-erythritol kinase [Dethiobacter sp.]|jgi:4-diphosphocytidyl-2-C-methyl-D-erythritol kinase|nr:4-(cytidine 5'-diphospho)-2-C-methyl-D-erythritol kinase [Dethiobacter sp.]MBS4023914.1 4-(cytidine 5'-diphospho)-2-C-methyl-D-erythritol kinase [Dethiobacter sp.]